MVFIGITYEKRKHSHGLQFTLCVSRGNREVFGTMKKILSFILAALMLATTFVGCNKTTLVKDPATGEYDKGAIIDIYLGKEVCNFDPQLSMTDDSMLKVFSLIYEGLTTINEKGKWEKLGMKSYRVESDDDKEFSIVVELKESYWNDGRQVQAADYVCTDPWSAGR